MLLSNPFVKVHALVAAIMAISPNVVCKGPTFGSPQVGAAAPGGGTPCASVLLLWRPEAVARAVPHRPAVDPQNRVPVDAGRPRTLRPRHRFPLSGPART
uniref:(northern house mosquito) hypothetical protein n=1 Tax=Culex pipiens TaxID=7175 RepID=A0A8D8G941_CULPI